MSAQHTPGPWRLADTDVVTSDGSLLAGVYAGGYTRNGDADEARLQANARLIAAAPELLEALEGAMSILGRAESNASGNPEWDYVGPRVAAARAAIAKARGQA